MVIYTLHSAYRNVRHATQSRLRYGRLRRLARRWARTLSQVPHQAGAIETAPAEQKIGVYVINLKHREDRLREFAASASKNGMGSWNRVDALLGAREEPGLETFFANSIACSRSHNLALQQFFESDYDIGLIFEDDVVLDVPWSQVVSLIEEFRSTPALDVLCLSYRGRGGGVQISENLKILVGAVGRGAYAVKKRTVAQLQSSNLAGIKKMRARSRKGKGDVMWGRLQKRTHFFAGPHFMVAHQTEGFSDIEQTVLGPR